MQNENYGDVTSTTEEYECDSKCSYECDSKCAYVPEENSAETSVEAASYSDQTGENGQNADSSQVSQDTADSGSTDQDGSTDQEGKKKWWVKVLDNVWTAILFVVLMIFYGLAKLFIALGKGVFWLAKSLGKLIAKNYRLSIIIGIVLAISIVLGTVIPCTLLGALQWWQGQFIVGSLAGLGLAGLLLMITLILDLHDWRMYIGVLALSFVNAVLGRVFGAEYYIIIYFWVASYLLALGVVFFFCFETHPVKIELSDWRFLLVFCTGATLLAEIIVGAIDFEGIMGAFIGVVVGAVISVIKERRDKKKKENE